MILGLSLKAFVIPAAERRQFRNGKSQHPKGDIKVNLVWRNNNIEETQPKKRRVPHQPKPTLRKRDPLKLSFGHDKRHDSNDIKF